MITDVLEARLKVVVQVLNYIETRKHLAQGYDNFPADRVEYKDRKKKFVAIDIGSSGAWLVEKETGEIYNIKGYGVPDYNKKLKADIGNIYTVDPEFMHNRRHNYLR